MKLYPDQRSSHQGAEIFRGLFATCAMALLIFTAVVTQPQAAAAAAAAAFKANFAAVGDEASIPYGWMDFCSRQPQECNQPALPPEDLALNTKTLKLLRKINAQVNAAIEPISNLDHWGTMADHWDYPTDGKGDCKIFALEKRRQLMEIGVPRQALLMTIVKDAQGAGHTILTVHTDKGDLILDNLTDEILSWDATGYRFVKRQSQEDPNIWLSILPRTAAR